MSFFLRTTVSEIKSLKEEVKAKDFQIDALEDQTPRMAKLKTIYANTVGVDEEFTKDSILNLNMGESVCNKN